MNKNDKDPIVEVINNNNEPLVEVIDNNKDPIVEDTEDEVTEEDTDDGDLK